MASPFLTKGGPEREEMHAMFELLCKNRSPEPGERELELSYSAVTKIFADAQKEGGNKKAKRDAWQKAVAQLITKGMTRSVHFCVVVGAEVLRNVGFTAQELLDLNFSAEELKAGFFEARELKEVSPEEESDSNAASVLAACLLQYLPYPSDSLSPARACQAGYEAEALKSLGYTPKELHQAEVPAKVMKQLAYSAKELRDGGYTAKELKDSLAYSLVQLKAGRYKAEELGAVGYHIPELRAAKFTALDLRKALVFNVQMMRDAGYTCAEMKKGAWRKTIRGRECPRRYAALTLLLTPDVLHTHITLLSPTSTTSHSRLRRQAHQRRRLPCSRGRCCRIHCRSDVCGWLRGVGLTRRRPLGDDPQGDRLRPQRIAGRLLYRR